MLIKKKTITTFLGQIGIAGIAVYQMFLRDVLHVSKAFMYAATVCCLICILYSLMDGAFRVRRYKILMLFIAFHIYLLFSGLLFSADVGRATSFWLNYSLDYVAFLCAFAIISEDRNTDTAILLIGIGAFSMLLMMLFNPAIHVGVNRIKLSENSNTNYTGLIFAIGFWMLVFLAKKIMKINSLNMLIAAMTSIGIMMTGSRKSLLILGVIFIFYVYNYVKSVSGAKKFFTIAVVILIICFGASYMVGAFNGMAISQRFASIGDSSSDLLRIQMYKDGLRLFLQNPIFGCGYQSHAITMQTGVYSHSNIIEVIDNGGIIGAIIYFSAFISIPVELIRVRKTIKAFQMENNLEELELSDNLYRCNMLIILWCVFAALSFVLVFIYGTLYQIYMALLCANVYYLKNKVNSFANSEY